MCHQNRSCRAQGGLRSSAARFTNLLDADEPEVRHRAEVDWNTLALELDDLPPFDERFAMMRELYVSLPWSQAKASAPVFLNGNAEGAQNASSFC